MSKIAIPPSFKIGSKDLISNISIYKEAAIDFLLGFALSNASVFSSCVPFGLSFYAATFTTSNWIAKFVSIILGSLFSSGAIGSLKYIFPLLIYTFASAFVKFERTYIKAGVLAGMLLLSNLVFAAAGGFLLYDVVVGITESFVCFVGVFIMNNAVPFLRKSEKRTVISPEELISITAMYAIIILCAAKIPDILGLSIANVLSITLILVMCHKGELGMGAAIGVVVGVINGINNYNLTSVIGAYALSALAAGIFKPYGKVGVCLGFILANSLCAIFLNSSTEILISIYDILTAAVLFFVLPERVTGYFTSFAVKAADASILKKNRETTHILRKKLGGAANSLKELSKMYAGIGDVKYTKNDVMNMFNNTAEKVCAACPTRFVCWQTDYKTTYKQMFEMFEISGKKGNINEKNIPEGFKNKCSNVEEFMLAFNNMTEAFKTDKIWRAKLNESRKNAANQLSSIGDVIKNISDDICISTDEEFENVIKNELDKLGIVCNYVWVVIKNGNEDDFEITVSLKNYDDNTEKKVRQAVCDATDRAVRIGRIIKNNGETVLKVLPSEKFSIDVGVSQVSKAGEEKCGDSYLSICLDGGGHILAISDGMGSGEDAHNESMSAIKLLEGFFEAGFETETSLSLINSSLLLKNTNDGFSTMDLCSVDLRRGTLKFIKICGAESYIKSGNSIEKIAFSSLPMGIMEKMDSPSCKRNIKDECMVVMISDGIVDSGKEGWIERELSTLKTENPKTVSEVILKKAVENCGGTPNDDMTVVAARVWS